MNMNYSTTYAVEGIEARAASGQRDFCIAIHQDAIAVAAELRGRGWSVRSVPSSLYGIEVLEVVGRSHRRDQGCEGMTR
jgi:hypothetical protein